MEKFKKTVDYPVYFRNVAKDKLPEEGSKVSLWATNLSQSIILVGNYFNAISCCFLHIFKK